MEFDMHIGPTAKGLSLISILIFVKWFPKYRMLKNHPDQDKKGTFVKLFFSNTIKSTWRKIKEIIVK
jgi:hypothetical protein